VNDGKSNDRLAVLRAKYEKELLEAQNNARILKAKLANLAELEHEARTVKLPNAPKDYAELGPTEGILRAVSELWKKARNPKLGVDVFAIKEWMLANGFKPGGFEFDVSVSVTVQRLRESGRLAVTQIGNQYYYRPKEK
jgi:hypothetical protein